jgi:hypothetical protein
VAIFNRSTHSIVPGLDVSISGLADAYTGHHRMKNIPPVILPPGDYVIVAKGYGPGEMNGNAVVSGIPYPAGDTHGGAISFGSETSYGPDDPSGFSYPSTAGNFGNAPVFLAGTFDYTVNTSCNTASRTDMVDNAVQTIAQRSAVTAAVYPNPGRGQFMIQLAGVNTSTLHVAITNASGQVVQQKQLNVAGKMPLLSLPFDLTRQPAGIYFIKIQGPDGVATMKVVVER